MKRGYAGRSRRWLYAVLLRTLLLSAVWLLLVADDADKGIGFGAAAVALALVASLVVSPPTPNARLGRLVDLLRYVAMFLVRSLLAGTDIARRVLDPRLPIDPGWRHYTLRLPSGPARVLLLATVTLLPGTLSAEMEGGELWVHVLDVSLPVDQELAAWEQRVARVFGINLHDTGQRQ